MDRGTGKTTQAIYLSAKTGATLVCATIGAANEAKIMAGNMGVAILDPISFWRYKDLQHKPKQVIVEDADYIIQQLLDDSEVIAMTTTNYEK